jgi:hypothetical protein
VGDELLGDWVYWIARQIETGSTLETILQLLLA